MTLSFIPIPPHTSAWSTHNHTLTFYHDLHHTKFTTVLLAIRWCNQQLYLQVVELGNAPPPPYGASPDLFTYRNRTLADQKSNSFWVKFVYCSCKIQLNSGATNRYRFFKYWFLRDSAVSLCAIG